MPPRKAPTSTNPDADATALILSYLQSQNRPYSAIEISSNLHNKVSKTKADKLLREMCERGEIAGNVAKQCAFWCLQDPKDAATPEELAELDREIARLREELAGLKTELKAKSGLLAAVSARPTTEVLVATAADLERRRGEAEARLGMLRSGSVKAVSVEERERVERELRYWSARRGARKSVFVDLEGLLLEGGEMKREELWETCGIDDDPAGLF